MRRPCERDPEAVSLKQNTPSSQEMLKQALAPVAQRILAERDKYTKQGWQNIALKATVTASGTRDDRFGPEHLVDNKTWELPMNGVVDYTLGDIETTAGGAYSQGEGDWSARSRWPLYVRPTYWLLPPRTTGSVTLTLESPTPRPRGSSDSRA